MSLMTPRNSGSAFNDSTGFDMKAKTSSIAALMSMLLVADDVVMAPPVACSRHPGVLRTLLANAASKLLVQGLPTRSSAHLSAP